MKGQKERKIQRIPTEKEGKEELKKERMIEGNLKRKKKGRREGVQKEKKERKEGEKERRKE